MIDGLKEWLRRVTGSLGDVYDHVRKVGSNFVEWCVDAPVVVSVLVGSTGLVLGWLYLVSYSSDPKPWVRGTGVLLQLIGFVLAAYGLERALEKFGQTPSTSRILPWLSDFSDVFETGKSVTITPGTAEVELSSDVSASVNRGIRPPQSDAERIRKLEQKVRELKGEIRDVRGDLEEEAERLEDRLENEIEAVEEDVQEVFEKVKEVNIGEKARWLEWSGVSFFVYGVPLASFPSSFLPAYRVLIVSIVAGTLLGSLHWYDY